MTFQTIRRLAASQSGATAIEYGLIVGLIFLVIVASVTLLSGDVSDIFGTVSDNVSNSM